MQEETLNALRRGVALPRNELEATCRDLLLEFIRRSQNLPASQHIDVPSLDITRRYLPKTEENGLEAEPERPPRGTSVELDQRQPTTLPCTWESRFNDVSLVYCDSKSRKSPSTHHKMSPSLNNERNLVCATTCTSEKLRLSSSEIEISKKSKKDEENQGRSSSNSPPSSLSIKPQSETFRLQDETDAPMTEEERLSFLKSTSKMMLNSSVPRDPSLANTFQTIPSVIPPYRPCSRDDLLYSPLNNNIFPLPHYPPMWNSLLPFPSFTKLYSPFSPPILSGSPLTSPLENFKNPLLVPSDMRSTVLPSSPTEFSKEETSSKQRFLDALQQVQRESSSVTCSASVELTPIPLVSAGALSLPALVTTVASMSSLPVSSPITTSSGDQPMDLTVRRKRKMAKSEIRYKPGEDRELEIDVYNNKDEQEVQALENTDDYQPEESSKKKSLLLSESKPDTLLIKAEVECSSSLSEPKFEVPMKIMKLENTGDTLIA